MQARQRDRPGGSDDLFFSMTRKYLAIERNGKQVYDTTSVSVLSTGG